MLTADAVADKLSTFAPIYIGATADKYALAEHLYALALYAVAVYNKL